MRNYVIDNQETLSAVDGYNIGFAQCHLNVVVDMLNARRLNEEATDPRLLVQFVSSMKQYPNLLTACMDNYDAGMQMIDDEIRDKLAKTFYSESGRLPSFKLTQEYKDSLMEIDLQLND